jgi:DNA-binding NtrC family response regulator
LRRLSTLALEPPPMAHPAATDTTQRTHAVSPPHGLDPAARRWHLHVLHAADPDQRDTVLDLGEQPLGIGRETQPGRGPCLVLQDPTVSRLHATLTPAPDGHTFRVEDRASSNGLFVNGKRVLAAEVGEGAILRVGDAVLLLQRGPRTPVAGQEDLGLVGRSPVLARLRTTIDRVAPSRLPVLVTGPTGTGKELVARALHGHSGRKGAFVPLNCAALPSSLVESILFGHRKGAFTSATADQEGAFVRAHRGTLFLDEIGDMPADIQPKLLRALETGEVLPLGAGVPVPVDVRIVVATHVSLEDAVAAGRFREDLLGRVSGVVVPTPPLRERLDDVPLLLQRFLPASHRHVPLSADAAEALVVYPWPRNVRELQKLAERLAVLHPDADEWDLRMLDDAMQQPLRQRDLPDLTHPERHHAPPTKEELLALLAAHGGNVSEVAAAVGRNRKQVYRWLDQHGLDRGLGRG